jgi:hypothetical protein
MLVVFESFVWEVLGRFLLLLNGFRCCCTPQIALRRVSRPLNEVFTGLTKAARDVENLSPRIQRQSCLSTNLGPSKGQGAGQPVPALKAENYLEFIP